MEDYTEDQSVTDMLMAILNCCTKEELEEEDEETPMAETPEEQPESEFKHFDSFCKSELTFH